MNKISLDTSYQLELIRFDRKVKTYLGICSFLFILFVAFKLHNSSVPLWNGNMNDGADERRGVVAGDPLPIRSDEWLVNSPFIVSQEKNDLPVTNEALGFGKISLIMGLPANHLLSIIKPNLWGYYFLDIERGFSWHWNFKIFPFLISSFLFLLLFTNNNFLVSLFGSIWLFLSSAIQWWSINTEIFTWGLVSIISLIYILYSGKTWVIILNGLLFLLASYSYVMVLYPAYQVPLSYFLLALLAGYVISKKEFRVLLNNKWVKFSVLAVSIVFLLSLLLFWYNECKETIQVVADTVYPGKRDESGGNFFFPAMFRDNFSWFLNQNTFPPQWLNICELSSFLMLSPIATILIIYSYFKTKKINLLFIPLLIFQAIIYIWLLHGFPPFLSRLTMFSTSPVVRTLFVFGFANIVFTLLYLSQFRKTSEATHFRPGMVVSFSIILAIVFLINYLINKQADHFFTRTQVINASILFAALNWLIVYFGESKSFQYLFYVSCFFFVASNLFINPLSKGLSPFFENPLYKKLTAIEEKDPEAGWIAFEHMTAPDFLKAAGINCFNGVNFAPPLKKLRILDPSGKNQDVYNRYAHVVVSPYVNAKDSIEFNLKQADLYTIRIDPCSPRLLQMGIKYLLFSYQPPEDQTRCLEKVDESNGFYIFKRKGL
ncbi:DUF7657 domain-containing protein [Longitalea luteola]|uniref:DUF7657 domain-containing protein n=1 Tax=Longitalea luteola TaxID=2812563 RepID=UPI001A96BD0A|nr:hypothetical protein [Longitalea luteola]